MRIQGLLPVTAGLVLFVAAASTHAAAPTACQLLNPDAASSLMGSPASAPVDMQGRGCAYSDKAGSKSVSFTFNDASMSVGDFTMMMKSQGGMGGTVETIPGVGEQNFFFIKPGNQNTFTVYYHGKMLTLSAQMKMTPALKTAMIQTMKQILAKI